MDEIKHRMSLHLFFFIGVFSLFIFFITSMPTTGVHDNPEIITLAQTIGVGHPAGFPTYSMISRFLLFLPLGNIALRTALISGMYGAFCSMVIYLTINTSLLSSKYNSKNLSKLDVSAVATLCLLFTFSATFWLTTVEAEVYSLNALFIASILFCAVKWDRTENDSWLFLGGLLFGLSSGNHGSVALYTPGLLIIVILRSPQRTLYRLGLLIFFFFVGFSVYQLLPIRASINPTMNFGNPSTFERFIDHVTDRKDSGSHFSGVKNDFQAVKHLWFLLSESVPKIFWPFGFPFLTLGIIRLAKENKSFLFGLLFIISINFIFFHSWTRYFPIFLPSIICIAYITGIGLVYLTHKFAEYSYRAQRIVLLIFSCFACFAILALIFTNFNKYNRSHSHVLFEGYADEYFEFPPDSVVLVVDHWFKFVSFQDVYRLRRDIDVITLSDLVLPEYFNPVTKDRFAGVSIPAEDDKIETDLHRVAYFILENANNQKRPLIMAINPLIQNFYPNLIPSGTFFYSVTSEPHSNISLTSVNNSNKNIFTKIQREYLLDEAYHYKNIVNLEEYYVQYVMLHCFLLRQYGYPQHALDLFKQLEPIFWKNGRKITPITLDSYFANEYGVSYNNLGQHQKARRLFYRAVHENPFNFKIWLNLGLSFKQTNEYSDALKVLLHAEELEPKDPRLQFEIGDLYQLLGDIDSARSHFRYSIQSPTYDTIKDVAKQRLEQLKNQTK